MRKIYLVVGSLLVVAGVAGFVLPSPLVGLFEVNTLHNIVHLAPSLDPLRVGCIPAPSIAGHWVT